MICNVQNLPLGTCYSALPVIQTRVCDCLYHLAGLVVKAFASRAADWVRSPHSPWGLSESSHTDDLKIDTPVANLPGAWRYKVSDWIGWSGVSILWPGEIESLIDLQLLSQRGSTYTCLWRSVPEIYQHVAGTSNNQQTTTTAWQPSDWCLYTTDVCPMPGTLLHSERCDQRLSTGTHMNLFDFFYFVSSPDFCCTCMFWLHPEVKYTGHYLLICPFTTATTTTISIMITITITSPVTLPGAVGALHCWTLHQLSPPLTVMGKGLGRGKALPCLHLWRSWARAWVVAKLFPVYTSDGHGQGLGMWQSSFQSTRQCCPSISFSACPFFFHLYVEALLKATVYVILWFNCNVMDAINVVVLYLVIGVSDFIVWFIILRMW